MRLGAYETYCLYLSLKSHFTKKSYDFFKYRGKVSASKESFSRRRDRFQFQKLSRKYSEEDMKQFILANILERGDVWVGDLLDDEADYVYQRYLKRIQSLTYNFTNEVSYTMNMVDSPKDLFRVPSNGHPPIIQLYLEKKLSLETMTILNSLIGFSKKFDEKLVDDFIWSDIGNKCRKYEPFIQFDSLRYKFLLNEILEEHK